MFFHASDCSGELIAGRTFDGGDGVYIEFVLFGRRFRFKITTSDWQLRLVRHMTWWRKLPGWLLEYRDWAERMYNDRSFIKRMGARWRALRC